MNIDQTDYMNWYAESAGAKVTIYEPGTTPIPSSDGLSVAPGMAVEFGMNYVSIWLFEISDKEWETVRGFGC